MMMKIKARNFLFYLTAFVSITQSLFAEDFRRAWKEDSDPSNFDASYVKNFYSLPREGTVKHFPWTSTFFPSSLGGIAYRPQTEETPFRYRSPSREEVMKMSLAERERLSPAEKYDIWLGRFDYPTVYYELGRTTPKDPDWAGLCHGWAPSAINFHEPRDVTLVSKDGIEVPFTSYDIKAYLSYYQGEHGENEAKFLGIRCNGSGRGISKFRPSCRGVNAGAFHVAVTNEIGIRKKSFVFDRDPSYQVWNQPAVSYTYKIVKEKKGRFIGSAKGTKKRVFIKMSLIYTDEVGDSDWAALSSRGLKNVDTISYYYRLELDKHGQILGGKWKSSMRPDFLWQQDRPTFSGYYGDIETIYRASLKQ